ncbi:MAG: hypothetical protein Q8L56_12265 [Rhodocyclaceae bacterium]|nr:hypothetical protein [Rhodocyclaceae bacterium]
MKSGRLPWLLLALVATAALAALGDAPDKTAGAAVAAVPPERLPVIRALELRVFMPGRGGDPFAANPPADAAPAGTDAVLPAPTFAAPLPWQVIGKQHVEGEGWTVFLARGAETSVLREGDTLDDIYRVTAIKPPTLTLLHLKRKTTRTLDIGEVKE